MWGSVGGNTLYSTTARRSGGYLEPNLNSIRSLSTGSSKPSKVGTSPRYELHSLSRPWRHTSNSILLPSVQHRLFRTTPQLQAIPPVVLLVATKAGKYLAVFFGRHFRNWWHKLPPEEKAGYVVEAKKHRSVFYGNYEYDLHPTSIVEIRSMSNHVSKYFQVSLECLELVHIYIMTHT